jgi:hypothetical protein
MRRNNPQARWASVQEWADSWIGENMVHKGIARKVLSWTPIPTFSDACVVEFCLEGGYSAERTVPSRLQRTMRNGDTNQ